MRQHEKACFTGGNGLYHTGTGKSSDARGTTPPTCDKVVSAAPADREIFTLTTSIAAVAEAALGRGPRYSNDIARVQMNPKVWEVPGDLPEISPSPLPDFGANIDKKFTERSSGLQSWGAYGVLWPVVHFELGIAPELGRGTLTIVPKLPAKQHRAVAKNVRLGHGSIDVATVHRGNVLITRVQRRVKARVTIGATVPMGKHVASVRLNGHQVKYRVITTDRGREVLVRGQTAAQLRLRVRVH
jgi:hypothetical protein